MLSTQLRAVTKRQLHTLWTCPLPNQVTLFGNLANSCNFNLAQMDCRSTNIFFEVLYRKSRLGEFQARLNNVVYIPHSP